MSSATNLIGNQDKERRGDMKLMINASVLLGLFFIVNTAFAQTGTYQKNDKGAFGNIAIQRNGVVIKADIYTWWNTASGTHGTFSGKGTIKDNKCTIIAPGEDVNCKIVLSFNGDQLKAVFTDCAANHLPDDFTGTYQKITSKIPGNYIVSTERSFFYKKPDKSSRMNAYLVKGDRVSMHIENIKRDGWLFVNFTNSSGQITSGYIELSSLVSL